MAASDGVDPVQLNPFPGLRPFRAEEDYLFFGREVQTAELANLLRRNRFVAVVGTSGSGKSSLVRAGLIPTLLRGGMQNAGSSWEVVLTRPGGRPVHQLAESFCEAGLYSAEPEGALTNLCVTLERSHLGLVEAVRQSEIERETNLLLVVDQFEELFRFRRAGAEEEEEAFAFVSSLLEAVSRDDPLIYVVITMRSDFIGDCSQFTGLAEAVNRGEYLIPRLSREQCRSAVEGPVRVARGDTTPHLVQRVLNDLGGDQDQLPVLQHALMRTWNVWAQGHDQDEPLDLRHYESTGGMGEALSRHADEVFYELPDDRHRSVAEKLFQALTQRGGDHRDVRRPTRFDELREITGASEEELRAVIDAYRSPGCTFLMPEAGEELGRETVIDISHESLMRVWRRLQGWVEEEAQSVRVYRRLADTSQFHAEGKAGLYRDPDLQIALSWREERRPNPAWAARYHDGFEGAIAFLAESEREARAASDARESARQRELTQARALADARSRAARNFKFFAVTMSMLALVTIALFFQANHENERYENENTLLRHEKGLTLFARARPLLDEGWHLGSKLVAAAAVGFEQYGRPDNDVTFNESHPKLLRESEVFQEVGRLITIEPEYLPLWKSPALGHHSTGGITVAYSPDGRTLASGDGNGMLRLWEIASGEEIRKRRIGSSVDSLNFSADGRTICALLDRHRVVTYDIGLGERVKFDAAVDHDRARLSPDGTLVAVCGRKGLSVSGTGGESSNDPTFDVAFSPDGRLVAALCENTDHGEHALRQWTPGALRASRAGSRAPGATRLAYTRDGQRLVAASAEALFVWDVQRLVSDPESDPRRFDLTLGGPPVDLALSHGAQTVALAVKGNPIHLLDITSGSSIGELDGHPGGALSLSFSPDGVLASGGPDSIVRLWNVAERQLGPEGSSGHASEVSGVVFSPDGRLVASFSRIGQSVIVWDVASGAEQQSVRGIGRPTSVAFSPDGEFLAVSSLEEIKGESTASDENQNGLSVRVFKVDAWDEVQRLDGRVSNKNEDLGRPRLSFTPDGTLLAARVSDGMVEIHDLRTGSRRRLETLGGEASDVVFSPDTSLVVATAGRSDSQRIHLWHWPSGERLCQPLDFYGDLSLVVSQDGTKLAAADRAESLVQVWNLADTPPTSWRALFRNVEGPVAVAFSPDGMTLAIGGEDGTARLVDLSGRRPVEVAVLRNHQGTVAGLSFSPDGTTLATAGSDQSIRFWDATRSLVRAGPVDLDPAGDKGFVVFSPDQRYVVCGNEDDRPLYVHSAILGTEVDRIGKSVHSAAFSPDGSILATGEAEGRIRFWDFSRRALLQTFQGHPTPVRVLQYSSDGRRLASGHGSHAEVWDVATGNLVFAPDYLVRPICFSPDGTRIAFGARYHGLIWLRDAVTGEELWTSGVRGDSTIGSLAFSPDGTVLASGALNGSILLWSVDTGDAIGCGIEKQAGAVGYLSFLQDGRLLAHVETVGARIWNPVTGAELATFPSRLGASLSPDGVLLATVVGTMGPEGESVPGLGLWRVPEAGADRSHYARYLEWYDIRDREVRPRNLRHLYRNSTFRFDPPRRHSHLGILAAARPEHQLRRELFRTYLLARSFESAALVLGELPEAESTKERRVFVETVLTAVDVEFRRGLFRLALRYLGLLDRLRDQADNETWAAEFWSLRSAAFKRLGRTDEATVAFDRGLERKRELGTDRDLYRYRLRTHLRWLDFSAARDDLEILWSLPGWSDEPLRDYLKSHAANVRERPVDGDDPSPHPLFAVVVADVFLQARGDQEISIAPLVGSEVSRSRWVEQLLQLQRTELADIVARAVEVLPPSIGRAWNEAMVLAWQIEGEAAPREAATDPEPWRIRRRIQRWLGRRAEALTASRHERDLRQSAATAGEASTVAVHWPYVMELAKELRVLEGAEAAEGFLRFMLDSVGTLSDTCFVEFISLSRKLGRDLPTIFGDLPAQTADSVPGEVGDWIRTVRGIRDDGVGRINCGGPAYTSAEGVLWSSDQHLYLHREGYARGGKTIKIVDGDEVSLYRTAPYFRSKGGEGNGYDIPVPSSKYRVVLHFAECSGRVRPESERVFDLFLEGKRVLESYDPLPGIGEADADRQTFEVDVDDGILDINFVPLDPTHGRATVSALEIERVRGPRE